MTQRPTFAEAFKMVSEREVIPMADEIMAAGADPESADFIARMLRKNGFYLVNPDHLCWDDIHAFKDELRKGQDYREDAGGFFVRALKALMGIRTDPVVTHQDALKAMLRAAE